MKIIRFEVHGLFGRRSPVVLDFNSDINILTGRNGAGKTSAMKLMWYVMSGNIENALIEINFTKAILKTDLYVCAVYKVSKNTCRIEFDDGQGPQLFEDEVDEEGPFSITNAEDSANPLLFALGSSVFLPTFRRIEGGFTMQARRGLRVHSVRARVEVEDVLKALAKELSNGEHTFVTSISSTDIVELLLRKYADLSQDYNDFQQSTSQQIIERIRAYKSVTGELDPLNSANLVLDEIKAKVEDMEVVRSDIMTPFDELRRVVERLFKHVGIRIDARLNFGDTASAVHSDDLSAGEKQLLSFLCYNAFYNNCVIFIDEPELSLHVDWQRQLFTILCRQNSTNQFVIATHSPFIYSKFPDKELVVDSDRGDANGE